MELHMIKSMVNILKEVVVGMEKCFEALEKSANSSGSQMPDIDSMLSRFSPDSLAARMSHRIPTSPADTYPMEAFQQAVGRVQESIQPRTDNSPLEAPQNSLPQRNAIIINKKKGWPSLPVLKKEVYGLLKEKGPLSLADIAKELLQRKVILTDIEKIRNRISNALTKLKEKGVIEQEEEARGARWRIRVKGGQVSTDIGDRQPVSGAGSSLSGGEGHREIAALSAVDGGAPDPR